MSSFTNTQNAFYSTAVIWGVVTSCSIIGWQLKVRNWETKRKLKDATNLLSLLGWATVGAVLYFIYAISELHMPIDVWLPWAIIPVSFSIISGLFAWIALRRTRK
jgi:hypothetical protein